MAMSNMREVMLLAGQACLESVPGEDMKYLFWPLRESPSTLLHITAMQIPNLPPCLLIVIWVFERKYEIKITLLVDELALAWMGHWPENKLHRREDYTMLG